MKTKILHLFMTCLFLGLHIISIQAQTSQVTYSADGLSGQFNLTKADYASTATYSWQINIPINVQVKIIRTNSIYVLSSVGISVDGGTQILTSNSIGEFSETITSTTGVITLNGSFQGHAATPDPVLTIKFANMNIGGSESMVLGGDLQLNVGVLRAYGSESFYGAKISAILGKDYSSYTCFGAINGGRIRGSNEGYLIMEGNPNGYGSPTIFMNRYVSNGNIIMTSSGGKVGIGVDAPKEKLHIEGAVRGNGTGGALKIKTDFGILELGAQDNSGVHFSTTKSKFFFNQSMDVQGTIRAAEVKVESIDNFPDYVFSDAYNLRPLAEVSDFIKANGHLPEIPSAQEVKENGMSLVEMNKKLLQKVEELTLYIIEQQRQIDELKMSK